MKKIAIYSSIIILVFVALGIITTIQKNKKIEEYSLYNKDSLQPETIALLDNPNYQYLILPEELQAKMDAKEDVLVYFYSSDCKYCMESTPILVELAQELNIEIPQFNLMEFPEGWTTYDLQYTPTLVQYMDGEETARLIGLYPKDDYKKWLEEISQ